MSTALVIFAKAPVAGLAKTRLAPALGAAGAAVLAERLLAHAVEAGVAAGFDAIELCVTPDGSHPAFVRLVERHCLVLGEQGDGDLGARMERAFARRLTRHSRVLLIGTDAPGLDAARLRDAAIALLDHDAVFVPAFDGGYALVGLRRLEPSLFAGIAWSTSSVMETSRERASAADLTWAELAAVADIDEPADLRHLPISFSTFS